MKRIGSVVGAATLVVMATALPALAGYAPGPPPPGGTHGGTAFTGSNLSFVMIACVILVVAGISLVASRALRTAGE